MIRMNTNLASRIQSYIYGSYRVYIFGDQMPTVDQNFTFNLANYTQLGQTNINTIASGTRLSYNGSTGAHFRGLATGTATWFALVYGSDMPKTIIGNVSSDPASKAPMLIDNVNIVPTTTADFAVIDFAVTLNV